MSLRVIKEKQCEAQARLPLSLTHCFGGHGRIRTAVEGFADLCLATRPRDQYYYRQMPSLLQKQD